MANRHKIRDIDLGAAAAEFIARRVGERDLLDPGRLKFTPKGNRAGRKPGQSKKRVTLPTLGSLAKLLKEDDPLS